MSSVYSSGYSADKCWDSDIDTYCYNKAVGDADPYFVVEFDDPIRVKEVVLIVTNKAEYVQHAKNIEVFVTNDKDSSGIVNIKLCIILLYFKFDDIRSLK